MVPDDPLLSVRESLTLDCWVRTEVADQHNRWIVNRVFGGGEATGYRLGLLGGKPCFEVPQAPWSHHLTAPEPLPLGRWVHLVGTFDGQRMRLFVDGVEAGALDRPGPIHPSHFDLVIGGFAAGSPANFEGRVDEVRLFSRALDVGPPLRPPHLRRSRSGGFVARPDDFAGQEIVESAALLEMAYEGEKIAKEPGA